MRGALKYPHPRLLDKGEQTQLCEKAMLRYYSERGGKDKKRV